MIHMWLWEIEKIANGFLRAGGGWAMPDVTVV